MSAQSESLWSDQPSAAPRLKPMIDPASLMAIRNLELRAKVVVQGFWHGIHRSPHHGFSVEFTEYRQYTPGDDPRFLDWRVYARSDRYFIKKFEDETNLRCHLLIDQSRSMSYGSLSYNKAEYGKTLAATLGYFLYRQGDAVGLLSFDEGIREYLPARNRSGHLRLFMLALDQPPSGRSTDLVRPLQRIVQIATKRGLLVLISDLLAPIGQLEQNLSFLTASGHEVILFQVLDPAEVRFDFDTAGLFHDVESGRDLYVDPAAARRDYLAKLALHNQAVQAVCQKLGIGYHQLTTSTPLETLLYEFLRERAQRGRRIKRFPGRKRA